MKVKTTWQNYIWKRHNADGDVIANGALMAKNLFHAKHLAKVYFNIIGEWIDRQKVSILSVNSQEYIVLEQKSL